MKNLFLVLILSLFQNHHSSAQLRDDFSDQDLSKSPTWFSDSSFILEDERLRSNKQTANSRFQIYTLLPGAWEEFLIDIELQFNTSSANYCDIYVNADSSELPASNSAIFIRIGNSSDEISLYQKSGSSLTKLIDGRDGRTNKSSNRLSLKLLKDSSGFCSLFSDSSEAGFLFEGQARLNNPAEGKYLGISVQQSSSSFYRRHFFDNIYAGSRIRDTVPPKIDKVVIIDSNMLRISLTEKPMSFDISQIQCASINFNLLEPDSLGDSYLIQSSKTIESGYHLIYLHNMVDSASNVNVADSFGFHHIRTFTPTQFSILINEIMADPEPAVELAPYEYIELKNISGRYLQLKACTLSDPGSSCKLPEYILAPDSFLILCVQGLDSSFQHFGACIALNSFPSLNNTEDALSLRNPNGELIHYVSYSNKLYQNKLKEEGGWSLELIDPSNPCSAENWAASRDKSGGTPGRENSVKSSMPDQKKPRLLSAYTDSDSSVILSFSENLDSSSVQIQKFKIQDLSIKSVLAPGPDFKKVRLIFNEKLIAKNLYAIEAEKFQDCSGNSSEAESVRFGLAETALNSELLINEILFNPASGGFDFIEIYNCSEKVLDLKDLYFARNDESGNPTELSLLSKEGMQILPGSYLVFTESKADICSRYFCKNPDAIIEVPALISLPDEQGTVILLDKNATVLDSVHYDQTMHYPLLSVKDGVSLERMHFNRPSLDRSNWSSAASTVNATPAYKNSQFKNNSATTHVSLENEVFSPDNDGFEDQLQIKISNEKPIMLKILVFSTDGILQRKLHHGLAATEAVICWDGFNDASQAMAPGLYVIYIELFDQDKLQETVKLSCAISGKY